jgi:hypothetical protein
MASFSQFAGFSKNQPLFATFSIYGEGTPGAMAKLQKCCRIVDVLCRSRFQKI